MSHNRSPTNAVVQTKNASYDVPVVWCEGSPEAQPSRETIRELEGEGLTEDEIDVLLLRCEIEAGQQ